MFTCSPVPPTMMLLWICYLALGCLTTAGLSLPLDAKNSQVKKMLPWKQDTQFLQRQGVRHARSADIGLTGCPKGFFVDGYDKDNQLTPDAKCEPCFFGTYNEEEGNLSYKCSLCREACDRKKEVELVRCTPFANRICACAPGYQEERPEPDLICIMDLGYMPCKAGERIRFLGMDIICEACPEDTTSFGNGTTCVPMFTVPSLTVTVPHAAGSEQGLGQWKAIGIILGLSLLLVAAVIGSVCICCVRKKQKHAEQDSSGDGKKPIDSRMNGSVAYDDLEDEKIGNCLIHQSKICNPTDDYSTDYEKPAEVEKYTNFNTQAGRHFGVQPWEEKSFLSPNRHADRTW